jgi:hypothetical protein
MASTSAQDRRHALTPDDAERLDGYVARARAAADRFRALVVAGLELGNRLDACCRMA